MLGSGANIFILILWAGPNDFVATFVIFDI